MIFLRNLIKHRLMQFTVMLKNLIQNLKKRLLKTEEFNLVLFKG